MSPIPSLFVAKISDPPTPGGTLGNFGETREKMAFWRTKAAISLKRVKMENKLPWRAYRNSLTLFRTVLSPTPYGLPFLEIGGLQATDFKFFGYIHLQGQSE